VTWSSDDRAVQHKGYHSFSHGAGGGQAAGAWQRVAAVPAAAGVGAACCTGDDHAASLLFFFKQKQTSYTFGKGSSPFDDQGAQDGEGPAALGSAAGSAVLCPSQQAAASGLRQTTFIINPGFEKKPWLGY
jgi:hypothetical protein